jgi:hypothetical protein
MKEIFKSVIRKKVSNLIKVIGKGLYEIVIDISLSIYDFNSIELNKLNNKIIIYSFNDNLEFSIDFDDLDEIDKLIIYNTLLYYV